MRAKKQFLETKLERRSAEELMEFDKYSFIAMQCRMEQTSKSATNQHKDDFIKKQSEELSFIDNKIMKHIIISLMTISLFSCSSFNEPKVDFSIKNSSQKVLKNIIFKTGCDSIYVEQLKPNESFKKELLYSNLANKDENNFSGFRLSFFRDIVKNDDFGCTDILNNNSDKKVNLIILENEIKSDIQGIECY